jgi:hypothetical protein
MTYVSVFIKKENGQEISKDEKLEFVKEVLRSRLGVEVHVNSQIVMEITEMVGSMWDDCPMPVAAIDLPDYAEECYRTLLRSQSF